MIRKSSPRIKGTGRGGQRSIGLKLFRFFRSMLTIKEVFGTGLSMRPRNITWLCVVIKSSSMERGEK